MFDLELYFRFLFALVFVIGLIGGIAWLAKRYGLERHIKKPPRGKKSRRLTILESLSLDARRRLLLLGCDGKEYLVVLGNNSETLLEGPIADHLHTATDGRGKGALIALHEAHPAHEFHPAAEKTS